MKLHSIETLGTHEGPGVRLLVFLQGCNAECVYCHNPDTWKLEAGKTVDDAFILERIEKSMPYFGDEGGITFSGGEPLLQVDELLPLMRKIKAMDVHTAVETNASIFNDNVKGLLDLTDLLLLDLKHIEAKGRKEITGLKFDPLKFADYREKTGRPFWLRYVLVPGFTDEEENLEDIANIFSQYKYLTKTEILPYHQKGKEKYEALDMKYKGKDISIPNRGLIDTAKEILAQKLSSVVVR